MVRRGAIRVDRTSQDPRKSALPLSPRAALLLPRREPLDEVGCRQGPREQVALAESAAECGEGGLLDLLLDPFGDRAQAERVAERDDRAGEGGVAAAAGDAVHERPVDLEDVHREALQVAERRV